MLINIEDETLLKEEHVAWFTQSRFNDEIELIEVVKRTYKHPEAPEYATIQQYELRTDFPPVKRYKMESSPLILLEAAQNNINHLMQIKEKTK